MRVKRYPFQNDFFLSHLSPERAVFDSPGSSEAEPWVKKITSCQALKGRYKTNVDVFISPFQGLSFVALSLPGAARYALTPGYRITPFQG